MREMLSAYAVTEADNGQQALNVLCDEKIDLVITDIRMPEMDGMTLLAHINEKYPGRPVVMITAHGAPDVNGTHLEKPTDPIDDVLMTS